MTSVNSGSGAVRVCDSTVAGETAAGVGSVLGAGAGAAVAVGPAVGPKSRPQSGRASAWMTPSTSVPASDRRGQA